MFSQSRNAIKQTIRLFDIIIMQSSRSPPWNEHFDIGGIFQPSKYHGNLFKHKSIPTNSFTNNKNPKKLYYTSRFVHNSLCKWQLSRVSSAVSTQWAQRRCFNVETTLKNGKMTSKRLWKKVSYENSFNVIISTWFQRDFNLISTWFQHRFKHDVNRTL